MSRSIHQMACLFLLLLVSWALLSPDPFASIRHTRLSFLQTISDIFLHCGAYSAFSLACCSLIGQRSDPNVRRTVIGLLVTHAVGTEVLQLWMPNRTCDPLDALANLCGITIGAMLAAWVVRHAATVRAS
ncbi:MAG: VanZ family protein [Planctomycetaceae bacterium]